MSHSKLSFEISNFLPRFRLLPFKAMLKHWGYLECVLLNAEFITQILEVSKGDIAVLEWKVLRCSKFRGTWPVALSARCSVKPPLDACSLLSIHLMRLLVLTTEHHLLRQPLRLPRPWLSELKLLSSSHRLGLTYLHDACNSVFIHAQPA